MSVLSHLTPQPMFDFFEQMCAIPHGSGNTKAISDWCVEFAKARNLRWRQDEHNNRPRRCPHWRLSGCGTYYDAE